MTPVFVGSGRPPVLHFDDDVVLDGRTFKRPVDYALPQLRPPEGVGVDVRKRPDPILDPRGTRRRGQALRN